MLRYPTEETYTIADLNDWRFEGKSLAVLGHPVRHSISPQMHNAALEDLARQRPELAAWRYFRFDVEPEQLVGTLPLFHRKGFQGLNLTVPHKELAVAAVEQIDPSAASIGAVNTLRRTETGYLGFNTDGYGLSQGVRSELGCELRGASVMLLGAGGAARAAAIQCLREGCSRLAIVNRNQQRLARLVAALRPAAEANGVELSSYEPSSLPPLEENTLLINATSLGLKRDDPAPLPLERLQAAVRCFDMIYNPATTPLMQAVAAAGGQAANGLSMLVHQGAKSLEIWTGLPAPVATMKQAALKAAAT